MAYSKEKLESSGDQPSLKQLVGKTNESKSLPKLPGTQYTECGSSDQKR
jgi:hypothetical protein